MSSAYRILAHRGHYNAASRFLHPENSCAVCRISTMKADIIELDLRKSCDGVLYCYHGGLLFYHLLSRFSWSFAFLQRRYHVDSLAAILNIISPEKTLFLDIKDNSITPDDLLRAFSRKSFPEVILGNRSVRYLSAFNDLPASFVKVLNGNIFCNFYDVAQLSRERYKYFEVVFPFQLNKAMLAQLETHSLHYACSSLFFFSRRQYFSAVTTYHLAYVSSDYL